MMGILLKNTFQNVVDVYDQARPRYPKELLDDVLQFANKEKFAQGLEIGAGTGQATDLFLDKIENLDLVEVGESQVAFLKEKYQNKGVRTYQAYFENFASGKKYDLIFSATAFHWVDANIGYPKAWDLLENHGVLAVFWHMSSVTYHDEGIFVGLDEIKKKYLPTEFSGFDPAGIEGVKARRISQIQSGGYFSIPTVKEYRWTDIYDADRYALLLESYSSTQTLDDEKRAAYLAEVRQFINNNGGSVRMPQHVMLYLVKKEEK